MLGHGSVCCRDMLGYLGTSQDTPSMLGHGTVCCRDMLGHAWDIPGYSRYVRTWDCVLQGHVGTCLGHPRILQVC